MKHGRVAVVAIALGIIGVTLQYGQGLVEVWLRQPDALPTWAVFSTGGSSFGIYMSIVGILTFGFTAGVAFAGGFYVGPQIDLISEYRRILWTIGGGSAVGITIAWGALYLPLYSFPSHEFVTVSDQLAVLLLVALSFANSVAQVGIVVLIGMFAGAALRHLQDAASGDDYGTTITTDDSHGSDQTDTDDEPKASFQPT